MADFTALSQTNPTQQVAFGISKSKQWLHIQSRHVHWTTKTKKSCDTFPCLFSYILSEATVSAKVSEGISNLLRSVSSNLGIQLHGHLLNTVRLSFHFTMNVHWRDSIGIGNPMLDHWEQNINI